MFSFFVAMSLFALSATAFLLFRVALHVRSVQNATCNGTTDFAVRYQSGRYQPMLRLLSEDDFSLVESKPALRRHLRAQRRKLFRRYLNCLAKDYGSLLAGVRQAMVQSSVDRPELARAIVRNEWLFAMTLSKIEFRLAMHAAGIAEVDVSGLVNAIETLGDQMGAFNAGSLPAAA